MKKKSIRTHDLLKLFNQIDESVRNKIIEEIVDNNDLFDDKKNLFMEQIEKSRNAFERMRYVYELANEGDSDNLRFLDNLAQVCNKFLEEYLKKDRGLANERY
ncbi:hypothetical protein AB9G22_02475 [Francisella philomiragia]|uniref:hypothetical protein n=1 Tax=Francisella philomiragia TaxID=28110 RepID=UPI003511C8F9